MKLFHVLRVMPVLLFLLLATTVYAAAPVAPSPTFPIGGEVVDTHAPGFYWNLTNYDAANYRLIVRNAAGKVVFNQLYGSDSICNDLLQCSAFPGASDSSFRNGPHTWRVIAINAEGRARTPWQNFVVNFPGAPTLTAPINNVTTSLPLVLAWDEVAQADQYQVRLVHVATGEVFTTIWINSGTVCTSFCSLTLYNNLRNGQYRWTVTARQVTFPNNRSRSAPATFRVAK
jgi:hypothetical protein